MQDEQTTRHALTVRDCLRILDRRRWWLLAPLFVCWAAIWTISWLLPSQFRSETLILVEQQKVPEEYVVANVSVDVQDRLNAMKQQVLSRTRLEKIIEQFQLYPSERKRQGMDAAVEKMRDTDVEIKPVETPGRKGEAAAFVIKYSAPSARLAQTVNAQLTSLFIDENIQEQSQMAENTTDFLSSELDDARSKLAEQEDRIKHFKGQHLGELPAQMESNVQILTGLQDRLRSLTQSLNRAQEQKLYLESLLAQYRSVKVGGEHGATSLPALDQELERLRSELTAAQTRYTEKHPDVIRLQNEVAKTEKLKQQIESDLASKGSSGLDTAPTTTAELQAMSPILQIQGQLKANELEVQDTHRQVQQMEAQIAAYQGRLNSAPVAEQQLADLTRDYDQSKANYDSLLKKQMQSQLATNLEKRQQGQQFRIIDPASLPNQAYSPDRLKFSAFGLLAGLILGIGCLSAAEYVDDRVRGSHDVKIAGARILVGIPHLMTPLEEQQQARRRVQEWCAAILLAVVIVAGNVLTFYKG
jgi:polysaccharide chain length determinant protein (PEP-CTERM system associated)